MKRGFTLIELLIVVAIIAILAAIAVPNFLEAQVRAKVSRIKNDMRAVNTGLEAYRVDSNKYPPWADWRVGDPAGANYMGDATYFHAKVPNFITTPIAYMTSIPEDIFIKKSTFSNSRYPVESRVGFRFQYFPYQNMSEASPSSAVLAGRSAQTGGFLFYSFGPDQVINAGTSAPNAVYTRYDPTNGTVSIGNIIRTAASPDGFIPYNPAVTGRQNGPN